MSWGEPAQVSPTLDSGACFTLAASELSASPAATDSPEPWWDSSDYDVDHRSPSESGRTGAFQQLVLAPPHDVAAAERLRVRARIRGCDRPRLPPCHARDGG